MKQFQSSAKYRLQSPESCRFCGIFVIVQTRFYHLDIPVTEFLPDKVVYFLYGDTHLIFFHVICYFFRNRIEHGKNPFVHICHLCCRHLCRNFRFLQIHHNETGSIPYFVGKVSAGLYSLPVETHIITRCISGDQSQTQCICTVFVNNFQRIDTISQRFTHLSSLRITNQTMEEYGMERCFSRLLIAGENHTDYPEENDIITGYQHICRVEIIHLFGFFRPAQCGKWPQCRGEPGIQRILILMEMSMSAFGTYCRHFFCHYSLSAFITIISRNPVPPPQLTGDTPVTDIVGPVKICLLHTFRKKLNLTIFDTFYCRFDQFIHLYKPLLFNHRFYGSTAAVMGSYIMRMRNNLYQKACFFQIFYQCLPALITIHTFIFSCQTVHGGIVIDNHYFFQIMTFSNFKVIRVMSRCNLYTAGSKFPVNIGIRNNRNLPVCHWQLQHLSDNVLVSFIFRIDRNSCITK